MSTANRGIIVSFGKKLGVSNDQTINKALELQRLISTKRILGLTASLEAVICLQLAASVTNGDCDKSMCAKLSGMSGPKYRSQLQSVSQLLQLDSRVSINELAVRHSVMQAQSLALQLLKLYREEVFDIDTSAPLYQAGALLAACKACKLKVDRRKLLDVSGATGKVFDHLVEKLGAIAAKLDVEEISSKSSTTKRKRAKTLIEKVEEKNKGEEKKNEEKVYEEKVPKKAKVVEEVDDYEAWKQKMLEGLD